MDGASSRSDEGGGSGGRCGRRAAWAGKSGLAQSAAKAQAAISAKAAPAQAQPWKSIPIPPLHAFKPTQPKRIELANGLVIFLQEDHELPFIDGIILIRGGSRDEPAAKVGLVSLYGEAWRTSGTATISGDALDTQLAEKAAAIETGGGLEYTSLEWSGFRQDFDTVFGETMELLLHPAFKADKLAAGAERDGHGHLAAQRRARRRSRVARQGRSSMERTARTRARRSTPRWTR